MDTKKPDPVARAARLLRESAQGLRETETLPPLHQWTGEDEAMARAAHDEYVAAADALEAWEMAIGAGGVGPLRKRGCLHQICETAAPASDGEYPKLPERAAFEDWIKKDGGDLRMFGSGQNAHYCNSAVNNAWGGWKASAARVATTASAPVVLPEPVAAQSRFADTPSDTWDSCSVEHARSFGGAGYAIVRAAAEIGRAMP